MTLLRQAQGHRVLLRARYNQRSESSAFAGLARQATTCARPQILFAAFLI